MYDLYINSENHRFYSNNILSHNSTSYTVFALWFCLLNKEKTILICANKFGTAKEILNRIKMAYEDLPIWLKPGIKEWNRASIVFENGCKICAEATSGSSGRGSSVNVLICDEFAFLKPGVEEEFLQSVFPVVSSSKTSKIILVSTPHGMGNEFYRIWNRASLDLDDNNNEDNDLEKNKDLNWFPVKVDWWDVPGRDEAWQKQQLATFGGNMARFLQEYGNSFLGSAETLIESSVIKKYKDEFSSNHLKGIEIQLHKKIPETKIKLFYTPQPNHAYIIGADPSMGMKSDYQAMSIWDITNTFDIKQVASFYENNVPPKIFAYILAKSGILFNNAYIAIENNGCSQATLDALWRDFEYDSIVHEGGNPKTNIGIHSMNFRKTDACLNFKLLLEDDLRNVQINDGRLLAEMEKFERKTRLGKMPTYQAADGHDDFMMATIWGFYILKYEIIERYYDIKKTILNKLNEPVPLYVTPFENEMINYEINNNENNNILEIDNKVLAYIDEYEQRLNEMKINSSNENIDNFIKTNNLENLVSETKYLDDDENQHLHDNDDFQFSVF